MLSERTNLFDSVLPLGLALFAILGGCGVSIESTQDPQPIFDKIDTRIGKVFPADVRDTKIEQVFFGDPVKIGVISVERVNKAFDEMFRETVELQELTMGQDLMAGELDGTIKLERVIGSFRQCNSNDPKDHVSVFYRVCLYENEQEPVGCWQTYQSREDQHNAFVCPFVTAGCVGTLLDEAIRIAIADIFVQVKSDPSVQAWAERVGQASSGDEATRASMAPESKDSLNSGDGSCIALIWWEGEPGDADYDFARDIETCLARGLERRLPGQRTVGSKRLPELLYPLMEPSTVPRTEDEFAEILWQGEVRNLLEHEGIRYVVAVAGGTTTGEEKGLGACGYNGCLGFGWWGKDTFLSAKLWDLEQVNEIVRVEATDHGTTVMPMVILPIPIPAATQADACRELASRLVESISDAH